MWQSRQKAMVNWTSRPSAARRETGPWQREQAVFRCRRWLNRAKSGRKYTGSQGTGLPVRANSASLRMDGLSVAVTRWQRMHSAAGAIPILAPAPG